MAKMKTYAVDVEVTVRRTVFINARRASTARAAVMDDVELRHALRYDEGESVGAVVNSRPADRRVVDVRVAGW